MQRDKGFTVEAHGCASILKVFINSYKLKALN